jgi:hypothetical protein
MRTFLSLRLQQKKKRREAGKLLPRALFTEDVEWSYQLLAFWLLLGLFRYPRQRGGRFNQRPKQTEPRCSQTAFTTLSAANIVRCSKDVTTTYLVLVGVVKQRSALY